MGLGAYGRRTSFIFLQGPNWYNLNPCSSGAVAGTMRSRRTLTAAFTTLAGVIFTSAAFAAASSVAPVSGAMTLKLAPQATTLLDRNGHFFTLSMSGIALPAPAQDVTAAKPNVVAADVTPAVRFEFAHGRNWDAY